MGNNSSLENDYDSRSNNPNSSRSYRSESEITNPYYSFPNNNAGTTGNNENTQLAILGNQSRGQGELIGSDGAMFSSRAPRDAVAGLSSGVKSAVKGVIGGVYSLIALPVDGARDDGVVGFAKGTAMGLTGAVILPITGTAVAVYQIGRGIYNTPSAFINSNNGLKWNKKTRNWESRYYHLSDDIEKYIENVNPYLQFAETPKSKPEISTNVENIKVVDYEYYDILQVDVSASKEQIKRQYYRLAKQFHPDKNPDDEEAKERFQLLGKAYQVLSDDELRAKYNEFGKEGTIDTIDIDMTALFTCLFGSEKLEPLTGKTATVFNIEYNFIMGNSAHMEAFTEFEKHKRHTSIALNLRNLIAPFCSGDNREKEIWRQDMKVYAEDLCTVSYGFCFVEALGWSYINTGTQFIGDLDTFLGYGAKYAKMKARWRQYGNKYTAVRSGLNAVVSLTQAHRKQKKKDKATQPATDFTEDSSKSRSFTSSKTHSSSNFNSNDDMSHSNSKNYTSDSNSSNTTNKNTRTSNNNYYTENGYKSNNKTSKTTTNNNTTTHNDKNNMNDNTTNTNQNDTSNHNTNPNNTNNYSTQEREEEVKIFENLLGNLMEYFLQIIISDLETTSRKSCKRLLRDLDIPVEMRRKRAEALIELGEIFQETAQNWLETKQIKSKTKIDGPAALDLLQEAMFKVAEKKNEEGEKSSTSKPTTPNYPSSSY